MELEERVIILGDIPDLASDHRDPLIENLFQVVGRDLDANDLALLYGVLEGLEKLLFMGLDPERHKVRPDEGGDNLQRFRCNVARSFPPLDILLRE